jgi:hypothetical protein
MFSETLVGSRILRALRALGCDGNGGLKSAIAYSSPGLPLVVVQNAEAASFLGSTVTYPGITPFQTGELVEVSRPLFSI